MTEPSSKKMDTGQGKLDFPPFLPSQRAFGCLVHMSANTRHASNNTNAHSHATLRWSRPHTPSQHTDINHSYSLEGNIALYFPQGSSSAVSVQHSHLVNVVSHPETEVLQGVFGRLCIFVCAMLKDRAQILWSGKKYVQGVAHIVQGKVLPVLNRSFKQNQFEKKKFNFDQRWRANE